LVVGVARSGTTWLARALASAPESAYLHEPDSARTEPLTKYALAGTPLPGLTSTDTNEAFGLVWDLAMRGGWPATGRQAKALRALASPRLPANVRFALYTAAVRRGIATARRPVRLVVKTVRSHLSTEWIESRSGARVLVVWRHPLNILPSWIERGYPEPSFTAGNRRVQGRFEDTALWPPPPQSSEAALMWALCAQLVVLLEDAAANPQWELVSHEAVTEQPTDRLEALFARLDLPWTRATPEYLASSDRPGTGFEQLRETRREAARWRTRLSESQLSVVRPILDAFAETSPVAAECWASSPAVR
jgi:hypothetical protein